MTIFWMWRAVYCTFRCKIATAVSEQMECSAERWKCRVQRAKQKLVWRQ